MFKQSTGLRLRLCDCGDARRLPGTPARPSLTVPPNGILKGCGARGLSRCGHVDGDADCADNWYCTRPRLVHDAMLVEYGLTAAQCER